jgi:lysophospholipase L1-like esterase
LTPSLKGAALPSTQPADTLASCLAALSPSIPEDPMQQILVYADSLSWGIVPTTRRRLPFGQRWPGVMENALVGAGLRVRVIEDCLNGRRTVWEDPFKPGRNGVVGLAQRIEVNSPLALVILMLGTNDFQSMHAHNAWHSAQGIGVLVDTIRNAPIEPGMPVPDILVVAPPAIRSPKGPVAPKFEGGDARCAGLAEAYRVVCEERRCAFFDAGTVVESSPHDGVHLDATEHATLGLRVADAVRALLAARK